MSHLGRKCVAVRCRIATCLRRICDIADGSHLGRNATFILATSPRLTFLTGFVSPATIEKFFDFRPYFALGRNKGDRRRRNEGDFKTFFVRNEGDSPAKIEKFFENRRRNEGENRKIFRMSPANRLRFADDKSSKCEKFSNHTVHNYFAFKYARDRDSNHLPRNHSLT